MQEKKWVIICHNVVVPREKKVRCKPASSALAPTSAELVHLTTQVNSGKFGRVGWFPDKDQSVTLAICTPPLPLNI